MSRTTTALVAVGAVVVITAVAVGVHEASVFHQRHQEEKNVLIELREEGLEDV